MYHNLRCHFGISKNDAKGNDPNAAFLRSISIHPGKILETRYLNLRKIDSLQDIKMRVIGHNQFRITTNSAINKLIIIRIILDQIIEKSRADSSQRR